MQSRRLNRKWLLVTLGLLSAASGLRAWDYAGHRVVNQAALAALPKDFPAFVREPARAERIAFLAGEPDRWRNVSDLPIKHVNSLDHYFDLEYVPDAGLDPAGLPSLRYDFVVAFAVGRASNPQNFPPIDPAKNLDHTREWPGFAPWAIVEHYGKLKSTFAALKVFEELGTPEEVANARANAITVMGLMGHYVGDLAQPLHTTVHHNGWVGKNPKGYTTWSKFHAWIDGGFLGHVGLSAREVAAGVSKAKPLATVPRADGRDPVFVAVMDYLIAQHAQVEPLYQLEKDGHLSPEEGRNTKAGEAFLANQLRRGGEMLAALWLTAWLHAPPDVYLQTNLLQRQARRAETVQP